jgi:hypothetical protein
MMSLQLQMEEEEQEGSGRKGDNGLSFLCSQKSIPLFGFVGFVVVVTLIQQALAATGGAAP